MRMSEQEYNDLLNRRGAAPAPVLLEDQEQTALVVWLKQRGIRYHATPNGGQRHKAVAGKLKAQGVVPGVPDLYIWPQVNSGLPILWIELKRLKGGTISESQQEWIDYLNAIGNQYGIKAAVCKGFQHAREFILSWGY